MSGAAEGGAGHLGATSKACSRSPGSSPEFCCHWSLALRCLVGAASVHMRQAEGQPPHLAPRCGGGACLALGCCPPPNLCPRGCASLTGTVARVDQRQPCSRVRASGHKVVTGGQAAPLAVVQP